MFIEFDGRLEKLKKSLSKLAREKEWKILVNEETLQTRSMFASDFDKMKYITLNVNQNRYCQVGKDGLINAELNDLCWSMPSFDEYGDYEIDEDTAELKSADNKFVLVEDIRSFRTIIAEFMEHPVKTETGSKVKNLIILTVILESRYHVFQYLFQEGLMTNLVKTYFFTPISGRLMQELEKDKDEYFKRHNITEAEQEKIDKMYEVNNQIDVSICKDEFANATRGASLHDENCPFWGPWKSIGQFGGPKNKCSKECGLGKRQKIRDCYIKGTKQNEADQIVANTLCINEFIR